MPISMSPSARYVTQSSIWSIQIGKNLTDRRIAQLQKQGYYDSGFVRRDRKAKEQKKRKAKLSIDDVFSQF